MNHEKFEEISEDVFKNLPKIFSENIDNVQIVIEDYPDDEVQKLTKSSRKMLLGLYQGIPLTHRGTWYGTNPTTPDKITLYQKNIESSCKDDEEIHEKISEVLLHELGHYFGLNETEIRNAMKRNKQIH
jgi:predicted Zn-dependent protease with MMP-like domain